MILTRKKNILDLIDRYLKYSKTYAHEATHSYNQDYLKALSKAIEATGLYDYSKYDKETHLKLIQYFKERKRKNSKINDCMSFLYRVLKYYNIKHNLSENYKLKDDTKHFDKLKPNELRILLNYMNENNNKYNLAIALMLDTGVRVNELLNIKYDNIDFKENSIYLEVTKNKKPRIVFFGELTKKYISQLNQEYIDNLTYKKIICYLNKIKREKEIKKLHAHMLRKTFAMSLYENNCPIIVIKDLLGHETMQMTLIYIQYDKTELKNRYNEYYCYEKYLKEAK